MQALHREFTKIINGTTQFTIPVFQRDYTWTDINCEQLLEGCDTHGKTAGQSVAFPRVSRIYAQRGFKRGIHSISSY